MSAVKEIRLRYRFSQAQMADYLGVGKSLVSLVELGRRSLPKPALMRLLTLDLSYENNARESAGAFLGKVAKERALLRRQLKKALADVKWKAVKLERQITREEDLLKAYKLEAAAIQKLLKAAKKESSPGQGMRLQIRLNKNQAKLSAFNPITHALSVIELKCVKQKIAFLEKLHKMPVTNASQLTPTAIRGILA